MPAATYGNCAECGAGFERPVLNPAKKYCSRRCSGVGGGRNITRAKRKQSGYLYTTSSGYRMVRVPDGHVSASAGGRRRDRFRAPEHILVAETALGRPLGRGEVVHHINCDQLDNRPENLLICSRSYHARLHAEMSRRWAREKFGRVA